MHPEGLASKRFSITNFSLIKSRLLRPATSISMATLLAVCSIGAGSLVVSQGALAAQSTACPTVLLGQDGNICTANDVSVAAAIAGLGSNTGSCMPGEQYTVNLVGALEIRKNDRWDIGVFIASDGKDLKTFAADGGAAVCEVAPLPSIDLQRDGAEPGESPVMGTFDTDGGPDQCGDTSGINNGDTVTGFPITTDGGTFNGPVTLTCVAGPNGKLQLQSLVSWNQNDEGFCDPTNPLDYGLTQISKCSFNATELEVEIVGRVTIRKTALNGGLNNFGFTYSNDKDPTANNITNPPSPFALQDGQEVEIYAEIGSGPATIVVDETLLPANWQFDNLSCTGDGTTPVSINGSEVTVSLAYNANDPAASQDDVVCTYTNIEVFPEVTLDKTTTTLNYDSVGDTIDYNYAVSNTGNAALDFPVVVSDDKVTVSCPADDGGAPNNGDAVLDPGESVNCTASYVITQADLDSGSVTNLADATVDGVTSNQDSETVDAVQSPAMTVVKSSPVSEITAPGVVSYSYLVTNTGNITLTGISLSDNNDEDDLSCPATILIPDATMTCTATHIVSQAEFDAGGSVDNTVTATSTEGASDEDSLSIPITQGPSLNVTKSGTWNDDGTVDGVAEAGETISYSIFVSNNGNITLNSISVTDPLITGAPNNGTVDCPSGNPIPSLAPGEDETCTATYTITAGDVSNGSRDNIATATSGNTSDTGEETVVLPDAPGLNLVKTGSFQDDITNDGFAQVGETIAYTLDVSNASTTEATNVAVTDPLITGAPNNGTISCPSGNPIPSLPGGGSEQCTASYTLTQADVDAGSVYNVATADSPQTDPVTDDHTEPLVQSIDWSITKTGSFQDENPNDGLAQPGETILYDFAVENTGLVTLTDVLVTDPKVDPITCPGGNPIPSIAPGDTVNCSGSYVITQPDIDSGEVVNIATGNPEETPPEDSPPETTPLPQRAVMTIVKTSATTEITVPVTVLYSYLVTNTGNVTLNAIALVDDNDEDDLNCPSATLAPTADMTCSASHIVTQAEIDANGSPVADSGLLENTVTGTATELAEPVTAELEIPINQSPDLTVQKSSTTSEVAGTGEVTYDYLVTNAGSVTLTGLTLVDNNVDTDVDCGGVDTLDPGQDLICSAVHTVTQQELDDDGSPVPGSGVLFNEVVASSNETEDASDNLSIPITWTGSSLITITKDFTDDNPAEVTMRLICTGAMPTYASFKLKDSGVRIEEITPFGPGPINCKVSEIESPVEGYTPVYLASATTGEADEVRSEEDGCYFDGIAGGDFTCDVTNQADPVEVDVHKVWQIPGAKQTDTALDVTISLTCDAEIVNGTDIGGGLYRASEFLSEANGDYDDEDGNFVGMGTATFAVVPAFYPTAGDPDDQEYTTCFATESGLGSIVEVDNGCGDSISTGTIEIVNGIGDECTITNTVFFEGIPTLSQWGMALMALLMLGFGFVGMRRYA